MNSDDVYNIVYMLQEIPGRNDKIDTLQNALMDPFIREIFRRTYDPSINYYITDASLSDICALPEGSRVFSEDVFDLLDKLSKRELSGNLAISEIEKFMQELEGPSRSVFVGIIKRSFSIGLNAASINKACPGLISVTPYMRCSTEKEVDIHSLNWVSGVYGQTKMDGEFLIMQCFGSGFVFRTRAGSIFPDGALSSLLPTFFVAFPDDFELHGEILLTDTEGAIVKRAVSNGVLNSLLQGGNLPANYNLLYVVWDMVFANEIAAGEGITPYYERFSYLSSVIDDFSNPHVTKINTKILKSPMDAFALRDYELKKGNEGIILKEALGKWRDGVSKHVIKLKGTFVNSLAIVGFTEGKGQFEGLIGALCCVSETGNLVVNVSGFDVATRREITKNQGEWLYKIVDVQHGGLTKPAKGSQPFSLIEPRLLNNCYRLDLTEADSLEKIRLT